MSFPFRKNIHKTGARNRELNNAASMANILVKARGVKSFPSCPVSAKIGINESTIIIIANSKGPATSFVAQKII